METIRRPKLELSYHRPEWVLEYTKITKHIRSIIPSTIRLCFMHVGSTAVKGLTARPIIDVAVGVINPLDIITVRDIMAINNYRFNFERSTISDLFMEKRGIGQQRFNIHICEFDSKSWKDMFYLTTLLKTNKQVAKEYATFKTNLLFKKDIPFAAYEQAKAEYIRNLLNKKQ